ncbi:MAG: glycoside hydrolase family 5 protein [Lachnospiraceae bacterium]|nr:glycoside hydrolase family 5 protein [Lachnospiraceae bacterium]
MKKFSKIAAMLLAASMCLGLIACGNDKPADSPASDSVMQSSEVVSSAEPSSEEVSQPEQSTEDTANDPTQSKEDAGPVAVHKSANGIDTVDNGIVRENLTALELVELMGNGINLGNTMEAYGRTSFGTKNDVSLYETFWGQPVTTQAMLDGMKAAGFDSIRIPIAWTNAMDYEKGDYTIDESYLNRVEEIINYAINADMYVVINDHWDGGWWGMFGSATQGTVDKAFEMYTSMWTQIAERYKEYSDKLIFEAGNEEIGFRLNDKDVARDSGALSDAECYEMANKINQTFVDTIRATGGNNANRFLLIAGFGTDITNTCKDEFKMPTDSAKSKLLLSVHYYDPSGYCIFTSVGDWGTKKDHESQNEMLAKMTKFTEQGYGIIIGEYGVLMETGDMKPHTLEYYTNFLANCDLYGYCPMLWDCNNMYMRNQAKMYDADVAQLYLDHSYSLNQKNMTKEEIIADAKATLEAELAKAEDVGGVDENTALAWIMYNSSDWAISYSVGDVFDDTSATAGIVATNAEITGEGTYTIGLDFTGTSAGAANSVVFSAIGISNGEVLYPGYIINIKEIKINGEPYKMVGGRPYTSSDDKVCTRSNLYNAWVTAVPDDARVQGGNINYCTPCVLDAETLGMVKTIEVTFEYLPGN